MTDLDEAHPRSELADGRPFSLSLISFFLYASFSIYDGLQEMNKFFLQRKKLNLKNLEKAENKTMSFCNTVTYVICLRSHLNRSERHMMR